MFWFLLIIGWVICCTVVFLFFYGAGRNEAIYRDYEDLYYSMSKEERDYGFDVWDNVVVLEVEGIDSLPLKTYFAYFLKCLHISIQRSFLSNGFKIVIVNSLDNEKYKLDLKDKKLYILVSEMNTSCFSLNRAFAKYVYENRELDRDVNLVNCFDMECDKVKALYFNEEASNGLDESPEKFFIELFVLYMVGYFKLNISKKDSVRQSYEYISKLYSKIENCERIDSINLML